MGRQYFQDIKERAELISITPKETVAELTDIAHDSD